MEERCVRLNDVVSIAIDGMRSIKVGAPWIDVRLANQVCELVKRDAAKSHSGTKISRYVVQLFVQLDFFWWLITTQSIYSTYLDTVSWPSVISNV